MDYSSYTLRLTSFIVKEPSDLDYSVVIPATIDAAEQRIYRELDLLDSVFVNSSSALTAGNRNFILPATTNGIFITVQGLNVITPAGAQPDAGTRVQLVPVSVSYLNSVWNSGTFRSVPKDFAMIRQDQAIVGPWPDSNYFVEVIGTIRPNPLSASNTNTYLTQYLPDLFLAASMVFFSKAVLDYNGATQGSPEWWESNYQAAFRSASLEELRKKYAGPGWTSLSSVPVTPTR
jgi:hypothetical protein